jgi:hypothetical protein
MYTELRNKLRLIAPKIERLGIGLSILFGGMVGWAFASGQARAWSFAFSSFISVLLVGMAAIVVLAAGERVPPGNLRAGFNLSCRVFFSLTTVYAMTTLAVQGLLLTIVPNAAALNLPTLALRMLPGLYLSSVLAIVLSVPLFLRWVPAPMDRP